MYRKNANPLVIIEEQKDKNPRIGTGKLVSRGEKPHTCELPGWWSRIWHKIENNAKFECVCSKIYLWERDRWHLDEKDCEVGDRVYLANQKDLPYKDTKMGKVLYISQPNKVVVEWIATEKLEKLSTSELTIIL